MNLVTQYIRSTFIQEDDLLQSITSGLAKQGMPSISVPPETGQTIYMLAKIANSRYALEIGTLGGYSTIWIARALPKDGKVTTIELKQKHADFAARNTDNAQLSDKVNFLIGDAKEILQQLVFKDEKFDFFFIDADKIEYRSYLDMVLILAKPGALILFDNLLLQGRVYDPEDKNPAAVAIRNLNKFIANHPKLDSMLLPVGDGLGVCRVKEIS